MTRHVRYKQLNKATIKQATINSIMLQTPTIEENRQVYKAMGIIDKGFFWFSPRRRHEVKMTNLLFLTDKGEINLVDAQMFKIVDVRTWK
ncbi:hypothetical protein AVV02_gp031 [Bacillus phage AvesoBmore]|uniref:Uncharacterized protein n=1 Tax=Bacillus phage AvesoBmore TaxID=1698451 RepID=A0A0K2D1J8_9CAUD|nr:hypothetical protein AVV02_gp031 [Bacillus phage AvesoBmore]ALA13496.1 hypothetical protein AVESOBMORE_31 [Bacillus phage AvesoBmore]UGO48844.1 hypothetical protein JARJAR_30 [Bacillus phage vB_BanH_JarJar]UGO50335.1 hypothetical protein RONSWANSON_29 [Bacillus phage vB_BanH_RonSwanson]